MWNKSRSIKLSNILVKGICFILLVLVFFVPSMVRWYDDISNGGGLIDTSVYIPLCATLYISWVFGMICIGALWKLLANINRNEIFTEQNTKCLRIISWCCIAVGIAFFIFGFWRWLSFIVSFVAVFFGLILRVLKNVFEMAVLLREENDYTI